MKASEQRAIERRAWNELYAAVHPLSFLDRRDLPVQARSAAAEPVVRRGSYVVRVPTPSR